jgi:hypothetical protein
MAEWKKIVVSGSDISQLNNDSGYLTSGGTIDSASVAARATTLSPDATASFADLASDARTADSASVAARATELSADATASYALVAGDARNADSASVAARATTLSPEATASHALYAVTASHALNVPDTASHALTAVSASIADELSQLATASFALVAGDARNADSASVAARATTLSADATASFADLASDARTADSASVAARATTLSPLATASFADSATTASQADSATLADTATTVANGIAISASSADFTGDITVAGTASFGYIQSVTGSAKIIGDAYIILNNNTPAERYAGFKVIDSGSANTTASFVFDGENNDFKYSYQDGVGHEAAIALFGPEMSDLSGSDVGYIASESVVISQGGHHLSSSALFISDTTASMNGIFSGSFEGDGSGLTGLATNLTVDGDTGTQNVNLIDDDLQVLGTTDRITTAVTKVGNDVKVTLDLPDTVEVTASVATRANELSPLATASFADLASDARTADSASNADRAVSASIADELSQLATASFADLASFARNAQTSVQADLATSASAMSNGHAFPTIQGLAGQGIVLDSNLDFTYGDFFGTGSTKKLNQTVAAATWSFQHSLDEPYPIVQAWTTAGDMIIPERIETIDVNNVKLYFAEDTSGVASAMVGGMGISSSNATRATSASIADEASTLSPTATASIADFATTASHALTGDGIFSGSFSGSFEGDGSNLTGVASTLAVSSSNDLTGDSINLKTEVLSFAGATNEVSISIDPGNNTVNVGLAHNVTVPNNLTVTGDLTVSGTTTTINTQNLFVEDRFILLNSGSTNPDEGGIVIDEGNGFGHAYVYDSDSNRFGFTGSLDATSDSVTPDAFVASVVDEAAGHSDVAEYQKPGNIRVASNGDIFIYS